MITPKIGDRAVYLPRVPYGRQSELFCFITRVVDADRGIVDLVAFPAGGEFQHINNVSPKGDVIQIHCWVPRDGEMAQEPSGELAGIVELLREQVSELTERLNTLEAKRGPGRPPKTAEAA